MATIEIDINNFPIANELLDTFKFKENNHLYQNLFEEFYVDYFCKKFKN